MGIFAASEKTIEAIKENKEVAWRNPKDISEYLYEGGSMMDHQCFYRRYGCRCLSLDLFSAVHIHDKNSCKL
nr:hypothetical protein [uncultured Blautia sp.]